MDARQTPWDVLLDLYSREINAGLQIDWDGGIVVWIGGPIVAELSAMPDENIYASRYPPGLSQIGNPIRAVTCFPPGEFDRIAPWLAAEARRIYPDGFAAK